MTCCCRTRRANSASACISTSHYISLKGIIVLSRTLSTSGISLVYVVTSDRSHFLPSARCCPSLIHRYLTLLAFSSIRSLLPLFDSPLPHIARLFFPSSARCFSASLRSPLLHSARRCFTPLAFASLRSPLHHCARLCITPLAFSSLPSHLLSPASLHFTSLADTSLCSPTLHFARPPFT